MASNDIKYFNPYFKDKTDDDLLNLIKIKSRRNGITFIFNEIYKELTKRAIFNNGK